MAIVYRAHDLRHDRPVAPKVLRPELAASLGAERFLREIRLAARLQHLDVLPVLDSGEVRRYLVLQADPEPRYEPGGTVLARSSRRWLGGECLCRVSLSEARGVFPEACPLRFAQGDSQVWLSVTQKPASLQPPLAPSAACPPGALPRPRTLR
jgi:serine/threonine protein kinase